MKLSLLAILAFCGWSSSSLLASTYPSEDLKGAQFVKGKTVISCSGTGVYLPHMLGVACWLYEQKVHENENVCFIGASGGSVASTLLASGANLSQENIRKWLGNVITIRDKYPLYGYLNIDTILARSIAVDTKEGMHKDDKKLQSSGLFDKFKTKGVGSDTYQSVSKKLMIALSMHPLPLYQAPMGEYDAAPLKTESFLGIPLKNRLICKWEDNSNLIESMKLSCYLPIISNGFLTRWWGNADYGYGYYLDGGASCPNNQPTLPNFPAGEQDAITVINVNPYFADAAPPSMYSIDSLLFNKTLDWTLEQFEKGCADAETLHNNGTNSYWADVLQTS